MRLWQFDWPFEESERERAGGEGGGGLKREIGETTAGRRALANMKNEKKCGNERYDQTGGEDEGRSMWSIGGCCCCAWLSECKVCFRWYE